MQDFDEMLDAAWNKALEQRSHGDLRRIMEEYLEKYFQKHFERYFEWYLDMHLKYSVEQIYEAATIDR